MTYLFNTAEDTAAMLETIGAASIDELFEPIPAEHRMSRPLDLPAPMTELELTGRMKDLAGRNRAAGDRICFLGGGAYDHFIPAVVDAVASRGEFYTSYTPYQPEVSQGNLQAMFEYQTLVCQLTGMDVSNASVYDGGTAAVEAVLMTLATSKRKKVVVSETVNPEYREIIRTYFAGLDAELVEVPAADGVTDPAAFASAVDDQTAGVLVQSPNVFGALEDVESLASVTHAAGGHIIQAFDPISLGLVRRPGDMGVDIAVAEGQSLGNPLAYGGPYLGILACKEAFVRRMPGRIAGETTFGGGRRCFVLTLQTREQHIRREKATSNICTNQGLFALRAAIYLSLMGPEGLSEAANLCAQKTAYLKDRIAATSRYEIVFDAPGFKEFVVRDTTGDVAGTLAACDDDGMHIGPGLGRWYPDMADCFLVAVTEKRTKAELDRLADRLTALS